jgi:HEPN domain-containing protein
VPREARVRRASPTQARSFLGKAEEFLIAARECLHAGRTLAATTLAVHAAISACDAICGARTGQRVAGTDHGQAVGLLGHAGREGKDAARLLTRLMPLEKRAEYEPQDVPEASAVRAVEQAEQIVEIARQVLG